MLAPHLFVLAVIVQHRHLSLGHARHHGTCAFSCIVLALVIEEPRHLQPLGIRVDCSQALIDVLRHLVQVVGLKAGWIYLIERVDTVDVVSSEQAYLFLKEHALDAAVQRVLTVEEVGAILLVKTCPIAQCLDVGLGEQLSQLARHMTRKGWQNGPHVQCAFAFHNASLQSLLPFQPFHRQRAAPAVDVGHAVPRQVGRACEVGPHLLVAHAQSGPHIIPHGLLPSDGQRQVHAVERHPVDEMLPLFPAPEGHRVAPRAVIQEETLRHACRYTLRCRHIGQDIG